MAEIEPGSLAPELFAEPPGMSCQFPHNLVVSVNVSILSFLFLHYAVEEGSEKHPGADALIAGIQLGFSRDPAGLFQAPMPPRCHRQVPAVCSSKGSPASTETSNTPTPQ